MNLVLRNDIFVECKSFTGVAVFLKSQRWKVSVAVDALVLHGAKV
jgi:hypothetical protein